MTRDESKQIQGIAIILMLYLHLFARPDLISYPYVSILDKEVQSKIAWTCKICVCMYSFVSGYGIYKLSESKNRNIIGLKQLLADYKLVVSKGIAFYFQYWMVFLLFIPVKFLVFKNEFDLRVFVENFLGVSWSYNGEWWYVLQYIKLLLLFPVIKWGLSFIRKSKLIIVGVFLGATLIGGILYFNGLFDIIILITKQIGIAYLLAFIEGMIVSEYLVFDKLRKILGGLKKEIQILFAILSIILVAFIRINLGVDTLSTSRTDFIFTPILVLGLLILLKYADEKINKIIILLGKYSIYMWLIHTFFAYYYWQKLVFAPYVSLFILVWLVLLSLGTAILVDKLYRFLRGDKTGKKG